MTSCYLFSFLLGTAIIIIFSSPMVDVISKFSQQIGISAFYTSFVVTPFVSNASEVIAAIIFASRKRKKNISLTYVPTHCIAIPYQCHGVTGWQSPTLRSKSQLFHNKRISYRGSSRPCRPLSRQEPCNALVSSTPS